MSISLNNHESRIASLENKSGISLTSGSGWVDFSNGLQMRFGAITINGKETMRSFTFPKEFSSACVAIGSSTINNNVRNGDQNAHFSSVTKSGFNAYNNYSTSYSDTNLGVLYIAIGYLISNSIRSLLGGGLGCL